MPDIIVKNQAQLDAAIAAAKGGETIKLAAGTYTSLNVNGKNFTSAVTIQSLDAANQANVTTLQLVNSSNLVVKNLVASQDYKPEEDWMVANRIFMAKNVTLDNVKLSGGTGDVTKSIGTGLNVRSSSNIKVLNSSFDHFAVGMSGRDVDGMVVKGNSFHDNRRDHTNFSEMNNIVLDSNSFTNLFPVNGEHPDAIQFMTRGKEKANTNVTISNNIVMQGSGMGTQGFFLGNEAGLPYENLNITNNLIYLSGYSQGINVVDAKNVNVSSNTVISKMDSTQIWIRLEKVDGGTVSNNLTDALIVTDRSSNITSKNNAVLSENGAVVRKLFDLNATSEASLANLIVKGVGYQPPVGSAAASLVAGQTATLPKPANPNLLLDLQFGANGATDLSRWSSDEPGSTFNQSSVSGGMYKVKQGGGFELTRATSLQLFGLPAFTLNFDMKRDSATTGAGQIVGIYKSWSVSLRADGELSFSLTNAAGKTFSMATTGAKLTDTATHKIALTYDSAKGKAVIYVDGVAKGSTAVSGSTRQAEFWGLYFGSQWGTSFSGGVGDVEMREGALSASEVLALNASTTPAAQATAALQASINQSLASNVAAMVGSAGTGTGTTMPSTISALGTATLGATLGTAAGSPFGSGAVLGSTATFTTLGAGTLALKSPLLSSKTASLDLFHV